MPFDDNLAMQRELLNDPDLPDELAAVAAQLTDDAELLAQRYTSGFRPASLCQRLEYAVRESASRGSQRGRWLDWASKSWTRAAALLAIAAGTTVGAIWQLRGQRSDVAVTPRVTSAVTHELASADNGPSGMTATVGDHVLPPTFVSAAAAESLSGEEIEVLADAFAGQIAEI
jgi:hypothetical protein